jgi:1,2-phenylacetyl-CoA epoxidase catalytic subunit
VKEGWLPTPSAEMRARFVDRAVDYLDHLGLPSDIAATEDSSAEFVASSSGDLIARDGRPNVPLSSGRAAGGRRGRHSDDFATLWTEMTSTYRSEPGASW